MNLMSWNVNGLRAVLKKGFLDFINTEKPDILCLQETKLQEAQIPQEIMDLEGYHAYWSFAEKKGYSGTCILTREEPLSVSHAIGEERFDREGRVVRCDYKHFSLFNVYFPNGKMNHDRLKYKLDFYDRFLEVMDEVVASGRNIVVCGDYNTAHKPIDLARPKANEEVSGFLPIERAWMDKLIEHGYIDTFRAFNKKPDEYSWWSYIGNARSRNTGWRIDYFFVNASFMTNVKDGYIRQDVMGSDHCPVGIVVEI